MPFSEQAVRDELRREAASVSVPDDMWSKISQRVDSELADAGRPRFWQSRPMGRSGLALVAALGMLFLTVIPAGINSGGVTSRKAAQPTGVTLYEPQQNPPVVTQATPTREEPHQPPTIALAVHQSSLVRLPGTATNVPR